MCDENFKSGELSKSEQEESELQILRLLAAEVGGEARTKLNHINTLFEAKDDVGHIGDMNNHIEREIRIILSDLKSLMCKL